MINRKYKTIFIVVFLFLLVAFSLSVKTTLSPVNKKEDIETLWNNTVLKTLQNAEPDLYNDAEILLVPLYASFSIKDQKYLSDFNAYFIRVNKNLINLLNNPDISTINKLDYIYFISNYIMLSQIHHNKIPKGLMQNCMNFLLLTYNNPAWNWNMNDFPNMKSRLDYKLNDKKSEYSYQKAIIDEELFLMISINNLSNYYNATKIEEVYINEIHSFLKQIVSRLFVFDGTHYAFQKGVWSEHRDFQYSSYTKIEKDMKPQLDRNIEEDISHYARIPLMLQNIKATTQDIEYKALINDILKVNSNYFLKDILIVPNKDSRIYMLKNYMSGSNGLYRWNYNGRGENYAHLPFSLSKQLYTGSFIFFSKDMKSVYKDINSLFPLSLLEVKRMTTLSDSSSELDWNSEYTSSFPGVLMNDYAKLNCLLSSKYDLLACLDRK